MPLSRKTVVGLGESLFDCYPDRVVLGGAPVNFAVHANALLRPSGRSAVPLTRIGSDDLGERFLAEMKDRGVSTDHVQRDPVASTGRVNVTLDSEGSATYAFEEDNAWDRLEWTPAVEELAANCDAICFGTLAQRSPASRQTIQRFLESAPNAHRVLDINLRDGQYDRPTVEAALRLATTVKLNAEELDYVATSCDTDDEVATKARQVAKQYQLDHVAVTLGAEGSGLLYADQWFQLEATDTREDPTALVDTVGAGDAFSAGLVVGLLKELTPQDTLSLANGLGGYVATKRGATPTLPKELYEAFL